MCGDVLADAGQVEGVEAAECREVRRRKSHVEVFRMGVAMVFSFVMCRS